MITNYDGILKKIDLIKPVKYARTRNFIDGSVSMLSPYISRGVISTKQVFQNLKEKEYNFNEIEKFVQELAWRDYWQLIWQIKDINKDIKNIQTDVNANGISKCITDANTGINVLDSSIKELYKTGYMHNHFRMYIAFLATNIAKFRWNVPANWMYFYLLDGDLASNSLSWQWICGANSNKKYIANQDNINKYTKVIQKNTFLDTSYDVISKMSQPAEFSEISKEIRETNFPVSDQLILNDNKDICVYNYYNLDPVWRNDIDAHRILLIEPSIFKKYPISNNSMNFMLALSKNIKDIKIFVGEFQDIPKKSNNIFFKEHPLNFNYQGIEDNRDWLCNVKGDFPSFFKFWNNVKKEIKF